MKNIRCVLIAMIFVFLVHVPVDASAQDSDGYYKVQPGECMSVIGVKLGLDWHELAEKNNINAPDYKIIAGSVLSTEGVKKMTHKRPMISSPGGERSQELVVSEHGASHHVVDQKNVLHAEKKRIKAISDGRSILDEFQQNNQEDKTFQGALKDFADNEEEMRVLKDEIKKGHMAWGYFRNHDTCDVAIDGQGGVHSGRINWTKGRDPQALEAAGVYKSPLGKQVWVFLRGGTVCFKHKESVETSISRVEEQQLREPFTTARQQREEKRRDDRAAVKNGETDRILLSKMIDRPSKKIPTAEDALQGFAREGLFEASRKEIDRMIWQAYKLPRVEPMDVLAEKEIKKISPTSFLNKKDAVLPTRQWERKTDI